MPKFNQRGTKPAGGAGLIVTEEMPSLTTFESGPGFARHIKGELFLLAVSNFVGEKTFYEDASTRDARFESLVHQNAIEDPAWTLQLVKWLRSGANMRSASLVAAAEAVKARLDAKLPSVPAYDVAGLADDRGIERALIDVACQRADEPGELLAYWTSRYGRRIPKPVKRGLADAARRLYSEYTLLKYDTASHGFRFADVLDLCHPSPSAPWQAELFGHALARRHGRNFSVDTELLPMVLANFQLRERVAEATPNGVAGVSDLFDPEALRAAGMTWEDVLSLAGAHVDKGKLWEALIPTMGYMALIRNLRNFDEANVSRAVAQQVAERLADPEQVAKSRQLPYRFLSAYNAVSSDRWRQPLADALDHAVKNIPALDGGTLILIDTSASMTSGSFSARSKMTPADAAALFGVALAVRSGANVHGFADGVFEHKVPKGASILRETGKFIRRTGEVGHGTNIPAAFGAFDPKRHTRVVILSDMQTVGQGGASWARAGHRYTDPADLIPHNVPVYGFNLEGYRAAAFSTVKPNRYELGGLTDATFRLIPMVEAGAAGRWPWETVG